jgi:pimeloyl-[acyl-carrier protein] synthase
MERIYLESIEEQLVSPEFFANPYPVYQHLQAEAPIYWSKTWGAWVLTSFADNNRALRSHQLFSSRGRVAYLLDQLPTAERAGFEFLESHYQVGLTHSDPPAHTRLRGVLTSSFVPQKMTALKPAIQSLVDELLDRAAGNGRMDIIEDLAYPLPAIIVAELLGAPASDIELLRSWAMGVNRLFEAGGRTFPQEAAHAQKSLIELRQYIQDLANERRRAPKNDVVSRLVEAESQGLLSRDELVATSVTLFVAGHETTTYMLGNGLLALLQHPYQLELLQNNPGYINPAVEEMLRYDTSVQRVWRLAGEDLRLGRQIIKRKELVLLMLGAANRDARQFSDPHRFDILRTDNRHLGFGAGIHFCLGAPLARLEIPIAVSSLLQRFPNLSLEEKPLKWRHDIALRGLLSLPVVF